jgi:rSAM/selenodomain-associated transferase 1
MKMKKNGFQIKNKSVVVRATSSMRHHKILDPTVGVLVSAKLCALGVMTKAPHPGKVKTRLSPPLTPQEAAALNVCFLRDVTCSISQACAPLLGCGVGIYTPLGAEGAYENILPHDFFLIPQRGNEFGERLNFAAEDLLKVGFQSVCLINSDSPTVPPASFTEAVSELAKPGERIVLGPSDDGGYYLIGMKQVHRRLFEAIDWSTERVFEQTLKRAGEIDVDVHELANAFDVDDRATLRRLCDELLGGQPRSTTDVAPETRKFLTEIITREGRERIWPEKE